MKRWFWFIVRWLGDLLLETVDAITEDTCGLGSRCWTCWEQRRYTLAWKRHTYWVMQLSNGSPFIREKYKCCAVCYKDKEFLGYEQRGETLHKGYGGSYEFEWKPIYIEGLSPGYRWT